MKKIRSIVPVVLVSVPVSLGAMALGCGGYEASDPKGTGGGGGGGAGGAANLPPPTSPLPCEVLATAGHACVTAHSTVRVIYPGYTQALYQVCKGTNVPGPNSCTGETKDIMPVNGYADAAAQDAFCTGTVCTVSKIYDQSGHGNDLEPAPPGGNKNTPGNPAKAADLKVQINGRSAYGLLFKPGQGYRAGCNTCNTKTGNGIAVGDDPEVMYMVSSQKDLVNGCCFDYGNAETTSNDDGNGTMEAAYIGLGVIWGTGFGDGPWAMADLENGLYAGWENGQDQAISTNTPLKTDFVTVVIAGYSASENGGKGRFAVWGGDAAAGAIKTMYDGIRPEKIGYVPMTKQGSLILSTGGDNSDSDGGRFYEGAMGNGVAVQATVDALQACIVAAAYGK
jgi:non-reducing end alpha-L-arabinofuranosidase